MALSYAFNPLTLPTEKTFNLICICPDEGKVLIKFTMDGKFKSCCFEKKIDARCEICRFKDQKFGFKKWGVK